MFTHDLAWRLDGSGVTAACIRPMRLEQPGSWRLRIGYRRRIISQEWIIGQRWINLEGMNGHR